MADPAPVVTADLWHLAPRAVARGLIAVARDRRRLASVPGLRFAKLLGTARSFSPRDADPTRWMLIAGWSDLNHAEAFASSRVARDWASRTTEHWCAVLRPLSAHGQWAGREPFTVASGAWNGPVAALTRARLRASTMMRFWRAVPPVSAELRTAPGLRAAWAIGEAPVRYQGTFSLWQDEATLRRFAYATAAHRRVVAQTPQVGWYREDLFARFGVQSSSGTLDGLDPLRLDSSGSAR